MSAAGQTRAQEFSWERVTAKVDDFYGVIIRRLAASGELPEGFHAPIPPSPRPIVVRLTGTGDAIGELAGSTPLAD